MYNNTQNGKAAAGTAATQAEAQRLSELRYLVLDAVTYSPYATAEEKARTAASVARCQSAEVLVKWYCNVLTLLSERELAPVAYATAEQKKQIICLCNHPAVSRAKKTKTLLNINRLTEAGAVALIAELLALTTTPPTRPAGAGLVVRRNGQLAVAALTGYAGRAVGDGGVSVSYVQAA
ncbi:hypothetical protein [Hymenobacter properus]|uniref:Uncharacterized protein n=1 Tax=Hymenobacter properus TaxID=2791026 RepID=A0A931BIK6_9BACT|nr:hypothetical protein [Hymenobacter properus]MBF9140853.1 hypothetical protein [Hymenobacter properus]MBR7719662.1 hypothetical protein [Microvirga sp. SRT04]